MIDFADAPGLVVFGFADEIYDNNGGLWQFDSKRANIELRHYAESMAGRGVALVNDMSDLNFIVKAKNYVDITALVKDKIEELVSDSNYYLEVNV